MMSKINLAAHATEKPHEVCVEFSELGKMHLVELPPMPSTVEATEILIKTRYSGMTNGTERHALLGEYGFTHFPSSHGYQCVGDVVAVGSAVTRYEVGQTVFFGHYVGHRGYHVVDIAHGHRMHDRGPIILPIPEGIDLQQAALFGVAGVGMRHVRRVRVGVGHKVWVIGAGLIGSFVAQCARLAGGRVTVSDINPHRLEIARTMGADRVVDAKDEDAWDQLAEAGPFNVIVDASGMPDVIMHIAENERVLAHDHPVIGLVAVRDETTFPWSLLHGPHEASIEVSCHFQTDDLAAVAQGVLTGAIQIEPLITHRAHITNAVDIYTELRERPAAMLGVIFDWSA